MVFSILTLTSPPMSCHILSFLAFPPAVSVRPLTPRSGYLTSHKSGWATSFCWRQRIRRHGFHQLPPIFRDTRNWEIRKLGRATSWHSWPFFYWENDDNPLGLGMFGVSYFSDKAIGVSWGRRMLRWHAHIPTVSHCHAKENCKYSTNSRYQYILEMERYVSCDIYIYIYIYIYSVKYIYIYRVSNIYIYYSYII